MIPPITITSILESLFAESWCSLPCTTAIGPSQSLDERSRDATGMDGGAVQLGTSTRVHIFKAETNYSLTIFSPNFNCPMAVYIPCLPLKAFMIHMTPDTRLFQPFVTLAGLTEGLSFLRSAFIPLIPVQRDPFTPKDWAFKGI